MPKCKCADCGMVGALDSSNTLKELIEGWRTNYPPREYRQEPICAVSAQNLRAELKDLDQNEFKRVVQAERDCDQFFPWRRGYDPKEHVQMMQNERLLKLEQDIREGERRFQAEEREKDRAWRETQERSKATQDRSNKRWDRFYHYLGLIIAALLGMAGGILGDAIRTWLGLATKNH